MHSFIKLRDCNFFKGLNTINEAKKVVKKFRRERDVKKESDKIILISEGSELILLSKRSFMTYADVDTICKIEKQVRIWTLKLQALCFCCVLVQVHPYTGEEEARNLLFQAEKWKAYKKNLLNNLVTHSIDFL